MHQNFPYSHSVQRAFVIFSDTSAIPFLRVLRRGFRHCFLMIPLEEGWLSVDPLWGRIELMTHHAPVDHRFIDLFKNNNFHVVFTEVNDIKIHVPLGGVFSCVSVLKRLLGVRGWGIQTPYQLYRHLVKKAPPAGIEDPFYDLFSTSNPPQIQGVKNDD